MLLARDQGLLQNSYYEASVQRPAPEPSLQESIETDVCVIGGGFAGLSTTIELRKLGYQVCILEAKEVGWGASGRNGGQVLAGYASDAEMQRQLSPKDAITAWNLSTLGVSLLRQRIDEYQIPCDWQSGFLNVSVNPKKTKELFQWAEQLQKDFGVDHTIIEPENLSNFIKSPRYHAAVLDTQSGHIHPLRYALGLRQAALKEGARLFENTPALKIEPGDHPVVRTAHGSVRCRYVVLAANVYLEAFSPELAPERSARIMPVGTYIIATDPVDPALARSLIPGNQAVCDNNFVLDYFRFSADHRMLFGGRVSYSGLTPRNLKSSMQKRMAKAFPELASVPIAYTWGGYVDITMNRAPDFARIGSNVYALQGFSGHGVALTGIAGQVTAMAIHGQAGHFDLYSKIQHKKFPGGKWLRMPSLVLGMWYYQLKEFFS